MIEITTMETLPEYCFDCPCNNGEYGECQADEQHRSVYYRPYWCPLKEQKWTSVKERYPDNSVDAFIKWCSESHMMGDATLEGIKYWVGKYKERL